MQICWWHSKWTFEHTFVSTTASHSKQQLGSRTLCFIAIILCYSFIPDNFAQLSSPLCPMCIQRLRDSSDRVGALSQSSGFFSLCLHLISPTLILPTYVRKSHFAYICVSLCLHNQIFQFSQYMTNSINYMYQL